MMRFHKPSFIFLTFFGSAEALKAFDAGSNWNCQEWNDRVCLTAIDTDLTNVNTQMTSFQSQLQTVTNNLNSILGSSQYNDIKNYVNNAQTQANTLTAAIQGNEKEVVNLRTSIRNQRDTMAQQLNSLISWITSTITAAQSSFNSAMTSYATTATANLQAAANSAYTDKDGDHSKSSAEGEYLRRQ